MAKFIEKKINNKYSLGVIAELIKQSDDFKISISYKIIYNYIDMKVLKVDREDLVYGNYRNKSKTGRKESAKTRNHKEGRAIRDRP